jgi:pimeloyl-ACP methyl ester carboxylesterase
MTPPSSNDESSRSPTRVFSLDWWVRDQNGRLTLAQWPNPALAVWLVAVVVAWTGVLGAARTATLAGVGWGALVVWALDELLRGVSPVRRLLGAVVLVGQLIGLLA